MQFIIAALTFLATGATAAPQYYDNSYGSTPTTHKVIVGGPGILAYNPPYVYAVPGDSIVFEFMAKNHSLTQSEFATPCIYNGLFDSGFQPNPDNISPGTLINILVENVKPRWFYCKQKNGNHCGNGMVFAVNPTAEKSFEKFQQMAIAQNGTAATAPSMSMTAPPMSMTAPPMTTTAPPMEKPTSPPADNYTPDAKYDDGMYHPDAKYDDGMYHPDAKYDDGMYHPDAKYDDGSYTPDAEYDSGSSYAPDADADAEYDSDSYAPDADAEYDSGSYAPDADAEYDSGSYAPDADAKYDDGMYH